MSAGNAGAAIGLANTVKIPSIGGYVQDVGVQLGTNGNPGPGADTVFIGLNGSTFYNYNAINELVNPAYLVPSNSGATAGRVAQWVTNSPLLEAGTTRVNVSPTGVATANNASGLFDVFCVPAAGIPLNSFFWVFQR